MLEAELDKDLPIPNALRTVADLVAERSGTDWPGIIAERIGVSQMQVSRLLRRALTRLRTEIGDA